VPILKTLFLWAIAILVMSNEQPTRAAQDAAEAELTQRLAQAEIVVSGVVVAVAPFDGPRQGFEHTPDWQKATIQIDTVEKGKPTTKTIDVLFASSTDIAWYRSPKLKNGDSGVWLLHNRDTFGRPVPGLTVVHAADHQPITDLAKIRELLRNTAKR
jgi:hypothetical protein